MSGGEAKNDPTRVLVVDDERMVRQLLSRVLREHGFETREASDGAAAVESLREHEFDVVVSDIAMPGLDGISLLKEIRRRDLDLPVILVTGDPTADTAIRALRFGALNYLLKPVDPETLASEARRAARLYALARVRRETMTAMGGAGFPIVDRAGLEVRFDRALDGLHMHFQPVVRLSDQSVFAYEALVRSNEPTIPHPGALLEAAERLDRLHDLGRAIRGRAVEPLSAAAEEALLLVNVHTQDLMDDTLFDPQGPLGRVAGRVGLEITERARLERIDDPRSRVQRLRSLGFRIAIDDIGAGYAGLTSFANLEPDLVKIDMTLVRNVETAPMKARLVASFIDVCRDLDIPVIAEGVETEAERDRLRELGCDLFQGFLFARPGPAFPKPSF